AERGFPVAGGAHALRPVGVIVDSGGAPGVTPNAYAFWRARRREGTSRLWHLVKGIGGKRRDRVERVFIETRSTGRRKPLRDLPLVQASTDALKDEICAALLRGHEGARTLRLLRDLPPNVAEEMSAERRGAKGWELRPGRKRNEALDLAVYALALAYLLRAEAIEPADPPDWARLGADNARAVPLTPEGVAPATDDTPAEAPERGASSPVPEAPPQQRGPSTMRFLRR
ncbi:terminase gpA endonuclease subunit, partial [Oceanicella sp. SM1341]|uniref:terminase gpA endonuclease subunit n=1 Tax=Oceanicella sp. SM1341 TaxID=1548889 RepID=UPI0018E57D98